GIAFGSAVGSTDVGGLIEGNYVDTVVGTSSGLGYGITKSAGSTGTDLRIIGNHVQRAQRHSIYVSVGSNVIVSNNIIKDHRIGQDPKVGRLEALVIARVQSIDVVGNIIDSTIGGAVDIEPDVSAEQNILGINLVGNL